MSSLLYDSVRGSFYQRDEKYARFYVSFSRDLLTAMQWDKNTELVAHHEEDNKRIINITKAGSSLLSYKLYNYGKGCTRSWIGLTLARLGLGADDFLECEKKMHYLDHEIHADTLKIWI